jgi:tetratricopeptide (TPR) repeat protein
MLQAENTSIDQIDQAADFYRKAVALFPQSREFADEREDLRELSSSLLELKYKQIAENLLADPYQDQSTIAEAVSFLRKAAKIQPNNSALQLDLQNVEYYQIALKDFLDMDWRQAIINFEKIIEVDPNFANGNAKIILFESYYLLGDQYYSAGFYQDALTNLEKAELLIWENRNDNLIRLFLTEVLIGKSLGAMEDYENAVSYFRYATNAINAYARLIGNINLSNRYLEANDLFAAENYQAAFDTYIIVIDSIDSIYSMNEIEIESTMVLALFADENQSITKAILDANELPKKMTIKRGQVITVPSLD